MGEIKKILSQLELKQDPYFYKDLRIEVSEAIHIHWRDTRILLTPNQFNDFINAIGRASYNWNGGLANQDTVLDNSIIPDEVIFDKHMSLESQENGGVHFHYNDIRIEMSVQAFVSMANMFKDSLQKYYKNNFKEVIIPLEKIDPYDHIHFPTKEQWLEIQGYSKEHLEKDYKDHQEGIIYIKEKIIEGYQIIPILVTCLDDVYIRRDGFKRYMAYKELRYKNIPVYVISEQIALSCPQNKQYPFRCK